MGESSNYSTMISQFGTADISQGKLTGTTDTDYFYFLCPKCEGGGSEIMRIIDIGTSDDYTFKTDHGEPPIKTPFHFALELYCDKCKTHSVVKITNVNGLLGGSIVNEMNELKHRVIGPNDSM